MKRRALAVVYEGEQYVCATVQEDGQMRVRLVPDWKPELEMEAQDSCFRVLVPPYHLDEAETEGASYFIWDPQWTPGDQNIWLQYFQDTVRRGVELPELLMKDFEFLARCLKAKNSKDWSSVNVQGNFKFTKLFAVLLGFKALRELRNLKKVQGMKVGLQEKEGHEGNPHPGKVVSSLSRE